jgi:hypothetical protein
MTAAPTWRSGVNLVQIGQGLNAGTLDLTGNGWGHVGEQKQIHSEEGMGSVQWKPAVFDKPLTWYRRRFDMPSGDDPVVLDMSPMGKGVVFVNGEGLGRYWISYKHALGGRRSTSTTCRAPSSATGATCWCCSRRKAAGRTASWS